MIGMLSLLALVACSEENGDRRFSNDQDCGTWLEVGQPLTLASCAPCHASGLSGEARHGAPAAVNLDTLEGARASASASADAVARRDMPPGGGLSEADAAALLAWLSCGAPGADHALPSASAPAGLLAASETRERALNDDAFPDGPTLRTTLHGGELNGQERWSEERYVVSGHRGWIAGRTLYDADGAELLVEDWDPPLLIYDGAATGWTVDSAAARSWPGSSEIREERWQITVGVLVEPDPRQTDPDALVVLAELSEPPADGPATVELGWAVTDALSFSRRWRVNQDADGARALEDHLQLTLAFPFDGLPEFPIEAEVQWMGRMLITEEDRP